MSNPNNPNPSKNPKKKMIIALSAIAAVIAVVIVAATVIDPPLFQGAIQPLTPIVIDTDPVVKDSIIIDTKLDTELKIEPILLEKEPTFQRE